MASGSSESVTAHVAGQGMGEKLETVRLCMEPFTTKDAGAAFGWFS